MRNDTNFTSDADDRDLHAYNAAFHELDLHWHWDGATYEALLSLGGDGAGRVRHYLRTRQPHLLRAYDEDFLVAMIERKAAAMRQDATASRLFDRTPARGLELGA